MFFFRVTCYGQATIVEVAYQTKAISETEEIKNEKQKKYESEESKLSATVKQLQKEKSIVDEKIRLVKDEKKILDDFSKCVSSVSVSLQ